MSQVAEERRPSEESMARQQGNQNAGILTTTYGCFVNELTNTRQQLSSGPTIGVPGRMALGLAYD
ncbi:hypothetical protein LCGC14_0313040 [marine sediment metagenome]|uniref:Uncharacterized protein n=1 Tax=marine sediment metagenome TaxID=412755 RepID=A0A0F9U3Z9_9ZZZZ